MSNEVKSVYDRIEIPSTSISNAPAFSKCNGDGVKIVNENSFVENGETYTTNEDLPGKVVIFQNIVDTETTNTTYGSLHYLENNKYCIDRNASVYAVSCAAGKSMDVDYINIGTYANNFSYNSSVIYLESTMLNLLNKSLDGNHYDPEIKYTTSDGYSLTFDGVEIIEMSTHDRVSFFGLHGYTLDYIETTNPGVSFEKDPNSNLIKIYANHISEMEANNVPY